MNNLDELNFKYILQNEFHLHPILNTKGKLPEFPFQSDFSHLQVHVEGPV